MKTKEGKISCPVLLASDCYKCGQTGHTPKFCTEIVRTTSVVTEESRKLDIERVDSVPRNPTWATIAAKTRDTKITNAIEEAERKKREEQEARSKEQREAERRNREEREERSKEQREAFFKRKEENIAYQQNAEKIRLENHVNKMKMLYGTRWFRKVEDTDDDCCEAERLREEEDERALERERRLLDADRDVEKRYKHAERTMTEKQLRKWEEKQFKEAEEEFEYSYAAEQTYVAGMPDCVRSYYDKTGRIRSANDFVSTERNAPLKPGLY